MLQNTAVSTTRCLKNDRSWRRTGATTTTTTTTNSSTTKNRDNNNHNDNGRGCISALNPVLRLIHEIRQELFVPGGLRGEDGVCECARPSSLLLLITISTTLAHAAFLEVRTFLFCVSCIMAISLPLASISAYSCKISGAGSRNSQCSSMGEAQWRVTCASHLRTANQFQI